MSTDFRSTKPIKLADLFDGRLERFGVRKYFSEEPTTKYGGALTDGKNCLRVWSSANNQYVGSFTRYSDNDPNHILWAIAETFDAQIVSEHEPEFWGQEPHEECAYGHK